MSTRDRVRLQSKVLRDSLLRDCRSGQLRPGDALPPIRELAELNGLSLTTTQRVLKGMADEGILQLRHGSGAFVGRLPGHSECAFASLFGLEMPGSPHAFMARTAFEATIADRGVASLALTPSTPGLASALSKIEMGALNIGGLFYFPRPTDFARDGAREMLKSFAATPRVTYLEDRNSCDEELLAESTDVVGFDHELGGRQSVRHLVGRGHHQLAFVALHASATPRSQFAWSRLRERGFVNEAKVQGLTGEVFHPQIGPTSLEFVAQTQAGYESSLYLIPFLRRKTISAVVCVNQFALDGLLRALLGAGLTEGDWPTMMAFDDEAKDEHLLSVIRLPWEELGRAAAIALWERVCGSPAQRGAPPREILVPMRLVMRLAAADQFNARYLKANAGIESAAIANTPSPLSVK